MARRLLGMNPFYINL